MGFWDLHDRSLVSQQTSFQQHSTNSDVKKQHDKTQKIPVWWKYHITWSSGNKSCRHSYCLFIPELQNVTVCTLCSKGWYHLKTVFKKCLTIPGQHHYNRKQTCSLTCRFRLIKQGDCQFSLKKEKIKYVANSKQKMNYVSSVRASAEVCVTGRKKYSSLRRFYRGNSTGYFT